MAYDPLWDDPEPFLVTRAGAADRGYATFRTARFRAEAYGVRISNAVAPGLVPRLRAHALVLPIGWFALGPTAARLADLPIPNWLDDSAGALFISAAVRPDVTPARPGRSAGAQTGRVRRHSLRWRRVQVAEDERCIDESTGLPTTTAARTFLDLAALLALPDLVAVGDAILRRSLATVAEIDAVLRRHRGKRGIRRARRALQLLDPRSESPQESRLRVIIIEAGLPVPVPNLVIRDRDGGFLARGDLVYEQARIVIEYDGSHHAEARTRERDATRRTLLRENGWYVVEITATDLRHPQRALNKVQGALLARGILR